MDENEEAVEETEEEDPGPDMDADVDETFYDPYAGQDTPFADAVDIDCDEFGDW